MAESLPGEAETRVRVRKAGVGAEVGGWEGAWEGGCEGRRVGDMEGAVGACLEDQRRGLYDMISEVRRALFWRVGKGE